jgi:hypothetical protein
LQLFAFLGTLKTYPSNGICLWPYASAMKHSDACMVTPGYCNECHVRTILQLAYVIIIKLLVARIHR